MQIVTLAKKVIVTQRYRYVISKTMLLWRLTQIFDYTFKSQPQIPVLPDHALILFLGVKQEVRQACVMMIAMGPLPSFTPQLDKIEEKKANTGTTLTKSVRNDQYKKSS